MRLEIVHETRYDYSQPVRESVMELWLQPLPLPRQRLVGFEIVTEPRARLHTYRDWLGNVVYHFDVPAPHDNLVIRSRALVETLTGEPLPDRLEAGAWRHLRGIDVQARWRDMLAPSHFVTASDALDTFMRERHLSEPPPDPLTGLRALNHEIHQAFAYVQGVTAADSPIDAALAHRKGVCQDFAHVMLAVARRWNIPARYVSGYVAPRADRTGDRSAPDASHAWVECYLPGPGWVGFDPTNDTLAGERHVVVAYGRDYADVPPTRGVLKGEATSVISVHVEVREVERLSLDSDFLKVVRAPRVRPDQLPPSARPPRSLVAQLQQQQQQ